MLVQIWNIYIYIYTCVHGLFGKTLADIGYYSACDAHTALVFFRWTCYSVIHSSIAFASVLISRENLWLDLFRDKWLVWTWIEPVFIARDHWWTYLWPFPLAPTSVTSPCHPVTSDRHEMCNTLTSLSLSFNAVCALSSFVNVILHGCTLGMNIHIRPIVKRIINIACMNINNFHALFQIQSITSKQWRHKCTYIAWIPHVNSTE